MAYKNTLRMDYDGAYYHVYNRGIGGMEIFPDEADYRYLEYLLTRYLSAKPLTDKQGREYTNMHGAIKLHTYCLMPNHFHILLQQKEIGDVKKMMAGLLTAYSMFFNKKYKRRGPLFESEYKAVNIKDNPQLVHVSRYIHLNPMGYRLWGHSSYSDYVYEPRDFVTTDFILSLFKSKQSYLQFVDDYEDVKRANDRYKATLGDI